MEDQNKKQMSPEMQQYINDRKNDQAKKAGFKQEIHIPEGVSPEMRQLIEDRNNKNK